MTPPDGATDPYSNLRETTTELARLLSMYPPLDTEESRSQILDVLNRYRTQIEEHAGAQHAAGRITNQLNNCTTNWHQVGRDLMLIAGAADGVAGDIHTAETLAGDAMRLAGMCAPLLLMA